MQQCDLLPSDIAIAVLLLLLLCMIFPLIVVSWFLFTSLKNGSICPKQALKPANGHPALVQLLMAEQLRGSHEHHYFYHTNKPTLALCGVLASDFQGFSYEQGCVLIIVNISWSFFKVFKKSPSQTPNTLWHLGLTANIILSDCPYPTLLFDVM